MLAVNGILLIVPAESDIWESAATPPEQREKKPLIVGSKMRCPNCSMLRDPLSKTQFQRLAIPEGYEDELNVIYRCVKATGGCGHLFSPGDPKIMRAYLAGELVPVKSHDNSDGGN